MIDDVGVTSDLAIETSCIGVQKVAEKLSEFVNFP